MSKKLFLLAALLGAFTMFSSCGEDDPCKDVDCGPNGTCFEGTCECNDGYEGDACDVEWATKFLGSYLGQDVVTVSTAGNVGTYNLTQPAVVTKVSESKIRISNFGGFESFIEANIERETSTSLTAEKLSISFTDPSGRVFTGSASISGNTLSGTYRVTYSDSTYDDATFTYNK